MKRKALLEIAGCTVKMFESYTARGFLPFEIQDRWTDYDLSDAVRLAVMVEAAKVCDVAGASQIAGNLNSALDGIDPLFVMEESVFVALVKYDWSEAPAADWKGRTIVGGRWADLNAKATAFVSSFDGKGSLRSIYAVNVSEIASKTFEAGRELGVLDFSDLPNCPRDLTGFPDWFAENERARRKVMSAASPSYVSD
ncbi:hypothetical protein [Pontivivens nitratireducens]|uniref:hypothetical protein n=1 Tax=Pontivivens nitratireducens TaxID=2758038 RepID=UPI00163ADD80|nr:hypothetical protein [Pontibrevibacter nitratireducens]